MAFMKRKKSSEDKAIGFGRWGMKLLDNGGLDAQKHDCRRDYCASLIQGKAVYLRLRAAPCWK